MGTLRDHYSSKGSVLLDHFSLSFMACDEAAAAAVFKCRLPLSDGDAADGRR